MAMTPTPVQATRTAHPARSPRTGHAPTPLSSHQGGLNMLLPTKQILDLAPATPWSELAPTPHQTPRMIEEDEGELEDDDFFDDEDEDEDLDDDEFFDDDDEDDDDLFDDDEDDDVDEDDLT